MFFYIIPYRDPEEVHTRIQTIFSKEELPLVPLLHRFFEEIQHGYIDTDYSEYSTKETLAIAVDTYHISTIAIQEVKDETVYNGEYDVRFLLDRLRYFDFCLEALSTQQEILLSTEILYENDVHTDDINFLVDGVERFLFEFCTQEMIDDEEGDEVFFEEEGFAYKQFDSGVSIPYTLIIPSPIQQESDIIGVFFEWTKSIGIDMSHKQVRLAKEEEFKQRPLLDGLIKQQAEDPESLFYIPAQFVFLDKRTLPAFDEFVAQLKNETAETIACVLERFSDAYIVDVLRKLPEKKEKIIHRFIQIPSTTLEERIRFITLFEQEFDLSYVEERMASLRALDCVQQPDQTDPQSQYIEYTAWQTLLARRNQKTEA